MRHLRPFATALLFVAALAGSPQPTSAQAARAASTAANDTAAMTDKARDLFREGTRFFREQKWAQAEAAFEAAWALTDKTSRSLVDNLGQTEMRLGKYREAAEHLSIARRLTPQGDKQLADVERDLAEAKKKIGTLTVTSSVDGARIVVGDTVIGKAPLADPVFVDPGSVTVSALLEGYDSAKIQVDIKAGEERPVRLTLARTAPAATATATATVSAVPTVGPPQRSMVPAYVMGGVGIASLIAGGVLIGVAESEHANLQAQAPRDANGQLICWRATTPGSATKAACDDWRAKAVSAGTQANVGLGAIIGGGVVVAVALAYWLWPSKPVAQHAAAERTWTVVPVVGASGGMAVWTGDF